MRTTIASSPRASSSPWLGVTGLLSATALVLAMGCVSPQRAAEIESAAAAQSPLVGQPAIEFTLPNQYGQPVRLANCLGEWVVLYFYPASGTPGCTCQAQEFTQRLGRFQDLSARVFGISPDPVAALRQFSDAHMLTIDLLADPEHRVMEAYGAWVRTPFGSRPIRSTVIIDPVGTIVHHWPEVIPEGHAERVELKLAELQTAAALGG